MVAKMRTRRRAGPAVGLALSLVAAAVLTLIQSAERHVPSWKPAWDAPSPTTLRVPYGARLTRDTELGRAALELGTARARIPRGTVLQRDDPLHQLAVAHDAARRTDPALRVLSGFLVFFALAMALLAYSRNLGPTRLRLMRPQVGLLVMVGGVALVAKLLLLFTALPEVWIPLAAVPLWVASSFDRRSAFVVTVVLAFVVASLLEFDLLLLTVLLAVGLSATLLFVDRKRPRHMVFSGLLAGVSGAALLVAILVHVQGAFDLPADLLQADRSMIAGTIGGGLVGGCVGALFEAPAKRLLGQVPRERLLDLTDLEQPLLQKMAREAPGSWEHSRAMANLAEQAVSAIGGDALLTRVGAYYHDLGKTVECKHFVENLGPDERSPHEDLEPDVSAQRILTHVIEGTRILRDGGIPENVVEFAYTHHGTQRVEYFWNKCQQQGNPKNLDDSAFRYPGMKPQTKETAVLMLVDSIEAASRTIDEPNRQAFETMIQRIIFTKLEAGQLDESGLTISDLRILVTRMAETLVNVYHHRIKYQWQIQRAEEFGVPSQAVSRPPSRVDSASVSQLPPTGEATQESEATPESPASRTERSGVKPAPPTQLRRK